MNGRKDCQFFRGENDCSALKAMDCRNCSFFKRRKGATVEDEMAWDRAQKNIKNNDVYKKPTQNP
jgi:hypothetical protein